MKPATFRKLVLLLGIAVCAAMSYFAYGFMMQARQSMANLPDIPASAPPPPSGNMLAASSHAPDYADPPDTAAPLGQDVVIEQGDFGYQGGMPSVRLRLANQGSFAASSVSLSLKLYAGNAAKPAAQSVGIAVNLPEPLPAGGETLIDVPIDDAAWRSPDIEQAKMRRVLAQVVAVGNTDNGDSDFPQTTDGVWLKQTINDWHAPEPPAAPPPAEDTTQPETAPAPQRADVDDILAEHNNLPTGEPRVLLHQESTNSR